MLKRLFFLSLISLSTSTLALDLTVEELRIEKMQAAYPAVTSIFSNETKAFQLTLQKATSFDAASALVTEYSHQLWQLAKKQLHNAPKMDDRPLYWARLTSSKVIRSVQPLFELTLGQRQALLDILEQGSRGQHDLLYTQDTHKKVLLTGFDPFLLDKNINQSNPSGIAAIALDGQIIELNGITAEINTVIVPVRYADFDQGLIESILAPYYALNNVDMIVTVSMGRENFDLERFPGKRRSVTAPDNLNIVAGGTETKPIISKLNDRPLPGDEFVEFSLPVKQMKQAKGPYKVIDNHQVTSLNKQTHKPNSLAELDNEIAVNGSGGGYLSNEISYRSIRLRNQLNSTIPTGHIHTPRIQQYDPEIEKQIVEQIRSMLAHSLSAL
ncbi:hypothetical protein [Shewanella ulleungensis]|jgi:pyrrolidone-carboxylate peptidase|uniref:hypothetical protein n=1 Tax=Shewanella ulleungensis TaxID=2282699 RepID=UPI003D799110